MRSACAAFLAAAVTAAPVVGSAQAAPVAPADAQAAPAPEKLAPPKVSITPYGFILVQSWWNDGPFAARDQPFQVLQNHDGGSYLISARGTRFGFKIGLPDDPFTGAQLSGVIEGDFKGGFIPGTSVTSTCTTTGTSFTNLKTTCTNTSVAANGTAWYNGIFRLRLGYITASWGDASSRFSLVLGQDWRIVAPLAPTSIAFGYDQMFTQAGNLNQRDPQLKAVYDAAPGDLGVNVSAAILTPQDTAAIFSSGAVPDYDAGNRSRMPNIEGRLAGYLKSGTKKVAEVGIAGAVGWRRYDNTANPNVTVDTTTRLAALDAVFNLPYLTVQGEGYVSDGMEDSYSGLLGSAVVLTSNAANQLVSITNLQSQGYWAQAVVKPTAFIQIPVGYGMAQVRYQGLPASFLASSQRLRNSEFHTGVLFNMSSPWKFGLEFTHTNSGYANNLGAAQAEQFVLASKLDF